jgi:hypothetical protein
MSRWSIEPKPRSKRRIRILKGFSASNGYGFVIATPGDEFWADINEHSGAAFIDVDGGGCVTVLPGEFEEINNG